MGVGGQRAAGRCGTLRAGPGSLGLEKSVDAVRFSPWSSRRSSQGKDCRGVGQQPTLTGSEGHGQGRVESDHGSDVRHHVGCLLFASFRRRLLIAGSGILALPNTTMVERIFSRRWINSAFSNSN